MSLAALSTDGITLAAVINIIIIDLVLSGDNAVVIAMAVKSLPASVAKRAAVIGAIGAVGLRIVFTIAAALVLNVPYLQAIGGAILFWIAYKLLIEEEEGEDAPGEINNFWEAVRIIILADVVMSLDNVLAVGGASHGNILLLLFGLVFSIPVVLFGSQILTTVLHRWPILAYFGSGILTWTAAMMIIHDKAIKTAIDPSAAAWGPAVTHYYDKGWAVLCTVMVLGMGYMASRRMAAKTAERRAAAEVAAPEAVEAN